MIVILQRDVKGTGKAGEVIKVSDGYARNMLLPKGYAIEATDGNVRNLEKQKAIQAQKLADDRASAQALADQIKEKTLTIQTKSGEGGKLFGSITAKDIAEESEKQLGLKLDKKKIEMSQPIKAVGRFEVPIKLFSDIRGTLTVVVTDGGEK